MDRKVKFMIAICCVTAAILIAFVALFIPPQGIIDASVLWFTAQLFLFTAAVFGVNLSYNNFGKTDKLSKSE